MANFKRTQNPYAIPRSSVRQFEGIGGPQTQVLRRKNDRGWDISNTVANDVRDVHLGERGSMLLRAGMRRLDSANYSIGWLGQIRIGGLLRYGMIYNNSLEIVDIPRRLGYGDGDFGFLEEGGGGGGGYSGGWPKPDGIVDDRIEEDPSLGADEQVCSVKYEWDDSPSTLSFVMPYGGPVPEAQNWYIKLEGYSAGIPFSLFYSGGPYVPFSANPVWLYNSYTFHFGNWLIGPCHGVSIEGLRVEITGKDSDGNWLEPGNYSHTETCTIIGKDGFRATVDCVIGLTVSPPDITLSPTSYSTTWPTTATGNKTQTINVKNDGAAGSVLEWEATISGDAALTALMSLSVESGELDSGENEDTVLTITNPGSLSAGTYTANIRIADTVLTTEYEDFAVTVVITPIYTGKIKVGGTGQFVSPPRDEPTATCLSSTPPGNDTRLLDAMGSGNYNVSASLHFFYDIAGNNAATWALDVKRTNGVVTVSSWMFAHAVTELSYDPATGCPTGTVTCPAGDYYDKRDSGAIGIQIMTFGPP